MFCQNSFSLLLIILIIHKWDKCWNPLVFLVSCGCHALWNYTLFCLFCCKDSNHYTRLADERRQEAREQAEHTWRLNATVEGRTMSKKLQWELYGNYVEPVPHPESPKAINTWNTGNMPVYCPEVKCAISRYVPNGKCRECTTPCINHARNTAMKQQIPGWENAFWNTFYGEWYVSLPTTQTNFNRGLTIPPTPKGQIQWQQLWNETETATVTNIPI